MSYSWNFGFQKMIDSVKEKYDKIVKPLFADCKGADKELADCHIIASRNIRSFIEEEAAESVKKKTVLSMEANLSSALKKNMEIHSEAYKALENSYDLLMEEVASEKEDSNALRKQLANAEQTINNFNDLVKTLSADGAKVTQEKEALRSEVSRLKEEGLKSSAKQSHAEEELKSTKKAHLLFAEAKERDVSELCRKMDRYQEQIAALGLICEKLQQSIPQDSSAIILTAMTKNEFDLKTAKPLVKAASKLDWMAGLDQTEICDHFCDSIVATAETENKILPIKKNIKQMASESKTKLMMEPEGTLAKLKKLKLVDLTTEKAEPVAKIGRKLVVRESSTASCDD